MARKRSNRPIDPNTGKPERAARVPLTDDDKAAIVNERVKLGRMVGNADLPDSMRDQASKLLGLGSTQLLRRVQKASKV